MNAAVPTPRTRQGARHHDEPNHASERIAFCRTHRHASPLAKGSDYRARVGGSRFLEVDPIEGGSANDYDYTSADPCNNLDLDGRELWRMIPGVRCAKAGGRFRSFITRQRRAFERINSRRDIPLSGAQQWEIIMTSGYAHDMLDYCGGDALKAYERMVRRGGR